MKPRKTTYIVHRWIGLVISVQLLAWSAGGFIFSVLDIRGVRGEQDSSMLAFSVLDERDKQMLPGGVRSTLDRPEYANAAYVALLNRGVGPFWEIRDEDARFLVRVDGSGADAGLLTEEQALDIALRDFLPEAEVLHIELIEADPPGEYRGKPMPAYRVVLDHRKRPHIYIDASTGEITARRNRSWRIFDFFWMLHTMDYRGRDDFNHLLLTSASVLAIATSGSGLALWTWRALPKRRRSGRPNRQQE
jgi:uncharacterized membrane protein YkoI